MERFTLLKAWGAAFRAFATAVIKTWVQLLANNSTIADYRATPQACYRALSLPGDLSMFYGHLLLALKQHAYHESCVTARLTGSVSHPSQDQSLKVAGADQTPGVCRETGDIFNISAPVRGPQVL